MELGLNEGRISGKRYYTVKLIFNEYSFSDTATTWRDVMDWCNKTFGTQPQDGIWTPGARWYTNNSKFWFRDEQDLTVFMLRWS